MCNTHLAFFVLPLWPTAVYGHAELPDLCIILHHPSSSKKKLEVFSNIIDQFASINKVINHDDIDVTKHCYSINSSFIPPVYKLPICSVVNICSKSIYFAI